MQSNSLTDILVPSTNETQTYQTDIFGGTWRLINLFAVKQDYFVYTEVLVSQLSPGNESKE